MRVMAREHSLTDASAEEARTEQKQRNVPVWAIVGQYSPRDERRPPPVTARTARGVAGLASKPTTGSATFSDASVENRPVFLRRQIGSKDDVNSARHK
jgi:hypothetical protein